MPNLTDGERCTRRSSRAYPQVNRRFGLLTEQEAHESRAAQRPERSRAMRVSIEIEAEDPREAANLARALLGAAQKTETVTLHVDDGDLAAAVRSGASRALAGQTATHGTSRA